MEIIKKRNDYYKELQRLSDPNSFFEDCPFLKEDFEEVLNALPGLYKDPSLLKKYDSDFVLLLQIVVLFFPLIRMGLCFVNSSIINEPLDEEDERIFARLRSKLGPSNSLDLFYSLKEAEKPFDREFYYKTIENPSILYRIQESIEKDDFNTFDGLLLEHADELKPFVFFVTIFSYLASLISSVDAFVKDDSEEGEQQAIMLLQGGGLLFEGVEGIPGQITASWTKSQEVITSEEANPSDLMELSKFVLRLFAWISLSGDLKIDEKEKRIFETVLYNPLFPDLFAECKKEIEAEIEREKTKDELRDNQEQPTETEKQLDYGKKRSLDDFDFVKEAHFDALYKRIETALFLYDTAQYCLFCDNCRLPLEQALYEFYHIAGITGKKIPDLQSGMIARLSMYLPEEVFPSSYKALYTDLNKITSLYHHVARYPQEEDWHEDAKKCYRLMIQCFHQLVEFKKEFQHYIAINGPIDFQKNLTRVLAARRVLPQFNSATYSRQPDYTSIALAHINLKESYRESLESELPTTYKTIFDEITDTFDYLIEALESSFSIDSDDQSLANLELITEFVPQVLATRHLHSYYSLIHSILFRDSWNPQEIADSAFAGTNPYIDDIFWGLININHFASKIVIDKLSGNELTRKAIKENIDEGEKGLTGFRRNYEKLSPEDHLVLDAIGHFKLFLIDRDCGALIKVKEQTLRCISAHSVSTAEIEGTIDALVFDSISELYNATKTEEWNQYYPFETKYVQDLLDNQFALPYLTELRNRNSDVVFEVQSVVGNKSSTHAEESPSEFSCGDLAGFQYSLPDDLFSGKVDIRHDFIPGLRNALKTIDVFSPLFNYILGLGGINSNKEAGALLRTFTGYPVDDADDKAKWRTDYHILYYLVKYMFTPKKSYAKMSECIDIYYPSDDERLKAERSPSSYAERISGSDAPSVIETLYRLSGVFPRPEEPVTD